MPKLFVETADAIASQLTELLHTQVLVSDAQNVVISQHQALQADLLRERFPESDRYLRYPIQIQNQTGEVLVRQSETSEQISARMTQVLIDLIIHQTAVGETISQSNSTRNNLSETRDSERRAAQHTKNRAIRILVKGEREDRPTSQAELIYQAQQLGIDSDLPRAVIVVDAQDFVTGRVQQIKARSQIILNILNSFFYLRNNTPCDDALQNSRVCGDLGNGEFAILQTNTSKSLESQSPSSSKNAPSWTNLDALKRVSDTLLTQLKKETNAHINIGIGRYHSGATGFAHSYKDAHVALRLGKQFAKERQIYCLDQLGIASFACVADEQTKVELATHLLSPLESEPDLLKTLTVLFAEDYALSQTAKKLVIHRNTLTYRLEKIAALTGLDPRRFDDAVQIRLALLLRSLKPEESVSAARSV